MNTDRELMQQALEALELAKNSHGVLLLSDPPQDPWKTRRVDSALTQSITALRERLTQPENGGKTGWPPGLLQDDDRKLSKWFASKPDARQRVREAVAQPEQCQCPACRVTPHASDCAVHNAPAYPKGKCDCGAQPEQEPGAVYGVGIEVGEFIPPRRQWVGLTEEVIWLEYQRLWPFHPTEEPTLAKDIAKFARAIEAKLREKNA